MESIPPPCKIGLSNSWSHIQNHLIRSHRHTYNIIIIHWLFLLPQEEPDMYTINKRRDMLMRFIDRDGDEQVQKDELAKFLSYAKSDKVRKAWREQQFTSSTSQRNYLFYILISIFYLIKIHEWTLTSLEGDL